MGFRMDYLLESLLSGAKYIPVSLKLSLIVFLISCLLGWFVATMRYYRVPFLGKFLAVFNIIYIGIPPVLALNVFYLFVIMTFNGFAAKLGLPWGLKDFDFMLVAYVALILTYTSWICEDFRSAYKAIDPIQFEAGYAIGLTTVTTLRRIILPQMIPVIMPNLINNMTSIIKNISLISAIGLTEIMGGALIPCGRTYSYLEGYVAAALIYWATVVVCEQLAKRAEKRLTKHRRQIT